MVPFHRFVLMFQGEVPIAKRSIVFGIPVDASVTTAPPFITADADPELAVNAKAARKPTLLDTLDSEIFKFDGAASGPALSTLLGSFDK